MRGVKAKRLRRLADESAYVDSKESMDRQMHKNGMFTFRHKEGTSRAIYQYLKRHM